MAKNYDVDASQIGKMLLTHEQSRIARVKAATVPAAEKGVELVRGFVSKDAVKLRESVSAEHPTPGTSIVGASASHALAYEKGTRRRKPKPFMAPALPQAQKNLDAAVEKAQENGNG